jgi:hypothetical protein
MSRRALTSGPSHHGHTVNSVSPIARLSPAQDDAGALRQQRQILFHDDDLGAEIDHRADVQRVTGEDDEIECLRGGEQPIKLRQ